MKASDISDTQVLAVVHAATVAGRPWATIYEVANSLPDFPWKIVHAKIRQMIRKGRLLGCPCGCRGDLRVPTPPPIVS